MKATVTSTPPGVFTGFLKKDQQNLARAATDTIKDAVVEVKQGGRAAIAAGGFSKRWQNAFRVNMYPASGTSLDPAMWAYSKIDYAGIFQTGGTIRPHRGLLWVPLPSAPKKIGGQRTTVGRYLQRVGKLQMIKRAGKPPVLVARVLRRVAPGKSATVSRLRRGSAASQERRRTNFVPIFVGLSSVTLKRRFNVRPVYDAASAHVQGNFTRHMEALTSGS